MLKVAVFASGNGSNFQALVDAAQCNELDGATIELLVCDKPAARVVERAQAAGIDTYLFAPKDFATREEYERLILAELERRGIDLIVLAGYMRIITSVLVDAYEGRMINVHPSLLPSFPGVNAIGQALAHGVKVTGVTVHFVDGGLDSGPIISQQAIGITPTDTEETLAMRIHETEQQLLPTAVKAIARKQISIIGRHVLWQFAEH